MLVTWTDNAHKGVRGYSELIIDSKCLERRYPDAIRAVFYQSARNRDINGVGYETLNWDSTHAEAEARRTRDAFASAYALLPSQVPLLMLDLSQRQTPFVPDAQSGVDSSSR